MIMKKFFAMALSLLALSSPHHAQAQDECQFLSVEEVNEILAPYEPWVVTKGGAGACTFEAQQRTREGKSVSIQSVTFSVNQDIYPSSKEAVDAVKLWRSETVKASLPATRIGNIGIGTESFVSRIPDKGHSMLTAYSHLGKTVVTVTLFSPGTRLSASDEMEMFVEMVKKAALAANKPGVAEQAVRCAALESPMLKQLIPGKIEIKQSGSDQCMAYNEKNSVVMFQRARSRDAEQLAQRLESESDRSVCQEEKLTQFTPPWSLFYNCSLGNPNAKVSFTKGLSIYAFSVLPGREPSAKQRADLIELAKKSFNALP
jgi:hypothetical protein